MSKNTGPLNKTSKHHVPRVLIAPTRLPPAAVLRQFAATARVWQQVHEQIQVVLPEGYQVLLALIKHYGCELLIQDEGLMIHAVLRYVFNDFERGQNDMVQRVQSFLMSVEDGVMALPGFSLHSPGVEAAPWTPMHQADFDAWRGDIPIHLLTVSHGEPLDRGQAGALIARLGARRLYEYALFNS